jgi:hypothetical protein
MSRPLRTNEYCPVKLEALQLGPVMVCANAGADSRPENDSRTAMRGSSFYFVPRFPFSEKSLASTSAAGLSPVFRLAAGVDEGRKIKCELPLSRSFPLCASVVNRSVLLSLLALVTLKLITYPVLLELERVADPRQLDDKE